MNMNCEFVCTSQPPYFLLSHVNKDYNDDDEDVGQTGHLPVPQTVSQSVKLQLPTRAGQFAGVRQEAGTGATAKATRQWILSEAPVHSDCSVVM